MRINIDIENGDALHEAVKDYADTNSVRMSRAYTELLEAGVHDVMGGC